MTALSIAWSRSVETENPSARRGFTREASQLEMRGHLRLIVGLAPERNTKAALQFAASVLRLPYGVCKRLLYGEVRRIEAHLADQVRAAVRGAEGLIEANAKLEAERRAFLAEAPQALARLAPGPVEIPEIEAVPAVGKRGAR